MMAGTAAAYRFARTMVQTALERERGHGSAMLTQAEDSSTVLLPLGCRNRAPIHGGDAVEAEQHLRHAELPIVEEKRHEVEPDADMDQNPDGNAQGCIDLAHDGRRAHRKREPEILLQKPGRSQRNAIRNKDKYAERTQNAEHKSRDVHGRNGLPGKLPAAKSRRLLHWCFSGLGRGTLRQAHSIP